MIKYPVSHFGSLLPPSQPARILSLVFYAATLTAAVPICRHISRVYLTSWYDRSKTGYLKRLSWADVRKLIEGDPLDFTRSFRWLAFGQLIADILGGLLIGCLWEAVRYGIYCGVPSLHAGSGLEDQMGLPIFLFGCGTLSATIIGLILQMRLKARSGNRQKWIDQIRRVLAELIADLPAIGDGSWTIERKRRDYMPRHAKLELLLNPSERDHRALLALIRHAYKFDGLAIDNEIRHALPSRLFATEFPPGEEEKEHLIALKSQIIRLSNAVLKREWEQVKHAR
jgi:hypothetical protein